MDPSLHLIKIWRVPKLIKFQAMWCLGQSWSALYLTRPCFLNRKKGQGICTDDCGMPCNFEIRQCSLPCRQRGNYYTVKSVSLSEVSCRFAVVFILINALCVRSNECQLILAILRALPMPCILRLGCKYTVHLSASQNSLRLVKWKQPDLDYICVCYASFMYLYSLSEVSRR